MICTTRSGTYWSVAIPTTWKTFYRMREENHFLLAVLVCIHIEIKHTKQPKHKRELFSHILERKRAKLISIISSFSLAAFIRTVSFFGRPRDDRRHTGKQSVKAQFIMQRNDLLFRFVAGAENREGGGVRAVFVHSFSSFRYQK